MVLDVRDIEVIDEPVELSGSALRQISFARSIQSAAAPGVVTDGGDE